MRHYETFLPAHGSFQNERRMGNAAQLVVVVVVVVGIFIHSFIHSEMLRAAGRASQEEWEAIRTKKFPDVSDQSLVCWYQATVALLRGMVLVVVLRKRTRKAWAAT